MRKSATLVVVLLFLTTSIAFSQTGSGLKTQIVNAMDGTLNNPTWSLASLEKWDDDEVISRMEFMINNTTASISSLIPNLKPSEQREVYTIYSELFRFSNDLDFEFQVVQTLRTLCAKYPTLKARPLLWIFSSKAKEQLAEIVPVEPKEEKSD